MDRDMNILYANPAAEKLTGYAASESIGEKCENIFCEASFRCEGSCPPKIAMREQKPIIHREAETKTKNGDLKQTQISFSPFYSGAECIGSVVVIKDITAIKEGEEEIKRQNVFLKLIIDSLPHPFYVIDAKNYAIKLANKASAPIGLADNLTCHMLTHHTNEPCRDKEHPCPLEEVSKTKNPIVVEHRHYDPDGVSRSYEVHGFPILDDKGDVVQMIEYSVDISDRKRTEEALLNSQMAMDSATDAIGMSTPEGRHYYQNEAFTTLFGLSVSEVDGVSGPPATVYADEKVGRMIFDTIMQGGVFEGEVKMLDKERKIRDIYLRAYSIKSKEGEVVGLVGVHTDITDRKRAEEKLRRSESQLRESQEVARLGNWDLDLVSQELEWSEETYRLFDKSSKDFTPSFNEFARLVHPDDLDTMQTNFNNALGSDDKPYHVAVRIINDSGREWVMEAFGAVRRDSSGTALSIFGTAQDITERKKAEEKIHNSEQFIRNILNTVDEGFIVVDKDYRILTANAAYCNQVGCYDEKIIGHHCYEISHKSSRPCYEEGEDCATRRVFETGKTHSALHRHKDPNGNILYVETKAFPIKDPSGAVTSVIETINNITEKHLLEEERLKTQKLESIGTLAGGIAHDFNNLLQGVFGYISLAKMTANNRGKSTAALEQAEKALHQSVNLTTQLLTFAKGGKPAKKLIDLRPIIENSAKFTLSGSRSDLRLNIPEDLWLSEADGGQLGQVIQNIVLNADQAMPIGGTIIVSATNVEEGDVSLPTGLEKGYYVKIVIQDNGGGIPEKYLGMIFDPYFTTKEKGSGLGLATSYSIVKNHGGMIDLKTKSDEGSTFIIYLPAIAGEVGVKSVKKSQELPLSHKGKILVMDDEEFIRDLSSAMIAELGHDVEVAKHGQEALEKYQNALGTGKPFDVVILDLTVRGGMGGSETIQKLIAIDPSVKAIVSSGYSDDAATAEYEKQGFKTFLKKPYDVDALREILSKMLGK